MGTGGFGRRSPQTGFGGLDGGDPNMRDEVRHESGLGRFIGVLALVMLVIGLGGGFTVRAEEKGEEGGWEMEDGRWKEVWRARELGASKEDG
jgi:hypothetical protein